MPTEKSSAIVLRLVEFSETSLIVTMFTREFGKISAIAKGARRPKSAFEVALDVLSLLRVVFIHKTGDVLDLLTEAKLDCRFRPGDNDLSRLYAGYYVAELLNELTDEADPHPHLFDAAVDTLKQLAQVDSDTRRATLHFEMSALSLLGHMPSFHDCVGCGELVENSSRVRFGQLAGGVLCERCAPGNRQVVSVSGESMKLLQCFSQIESDDWRTIELTARPHAETRGVLNQFLNGLLGKPLKMHKYLGRERI